MCGAAQGLSEELKGTERGESMKKDAEELLSFADDMKHTEQAEHALAGGKLSVSSRGATFTLRPA